MLSSAVHAERPILAHRDATIVSLQFGLALRNQEVYGLRWSSFADNARAHITQVLSWNALDDWAKTEHATGRTAKVPALLTDDLNPMARASTPARPSGPRRRLHHSRRPRGERLWHTRGRHRRLPPLSGNQAKKWGPRYMTPAVKAVA
jgi:hypothetical protein